MIAASVERIGQFALRFFIGKQHMRPMTDQKHQEDGVVVRPLAQPDIAAADHVMRVAFGTFLGLPEPASFMGDAAYVLPRWKAAPESAFAATMDDELVGSVFATNWGSVGFFGPLTVRPDRWDRGVGRRLLEPVMGCFERWGTKHAGLFTFPHSQKHIGLYLKFGFYPRFLTAVMSKPVAPELPRSAPSKFSAAGESQREQILSSCRELTNAIYDGLDVSHEIRAVANQNLGDTLLVWSDGALAAFAVCHNGPGSEAGSGTCYVKVAAARPGSDAERNFETLLDTCEAFARERNASRIAAGVNTAREKAYRRMLARGFRTDMLGVVMSRPNEPGYNRPETYLIDDWR
jgi:GNAT superfamily N-acetyltransferase